MADQQNEDNAISSCENHHILQLNDDCLMEIFGYFSMIELCHLSDTCKRFQNIARIVYTRQWKKSFAIPKYGITFTDTPRVLRCFGDLIDEVVVSNIWEFMEPVQLMNPENFAKAFTWLERYCSDTLQSVAIIDKDNHALPPSAVRLLAKVKKISIYSTIALPNVREVLCECEQLVELTMPMNEGPFNLYDLNFPHLRKLAINVKVGRYNHLRQLERFFQSHSKITDLNIQFQTRLSYGVSIDLSFISYLVDLEVLRLMFGEGKISHTEAFANLKKLKKLVFDHSKKVETDIALLANVAPDNLEELRLGLSEINDLVPTIERFVNLTRLTITQDLLPIFCELDINISGLSRLRNSRLVQLKVVCKKLLEPQTIVDVIRNLSELKVISFSCKIGLTESICKQLAAICADRKSSIEICLCEELMDSQDTDFGYIDNFNEIYGEFVTIKTI